MTADLAMQIPAVARCIDMISGAVSALPVKLYKPVADGMREIKDDVRVMLLNSKTGDSLNADEMRRMWVKDYMLAGSAYAVIDKNLYGEFKRILYVSPKSVAVSCNRVDPVNKLFEYRISGRKYYPYQLLKILRHSDGYGKGKGIVCENSLALSVGYNMLRFEKTLISSGGNKRGFLKAEKHLNEEAMNKLKEAWKKLYSNSGDGCIILNDGMDFKEASSTNMEMQLSQNITLSNNSIYNIFGTKDGSLNEETVRNSIMPVLDSFEAAFDADLLTEKEKEAGYYFAFDTRELTRGDITKRYSAYATALDKGFMQIDEVRKEEDLPPLGIKFVKLNLADSFYDPETQMIYTPNTNQWAKFGESAENGLTEQENSGIIEERGNDKHEKDGRFGCKGLDEAENSADNKENNVIKNSDKVIIPKEKIVDFFLKPGTKHFAEFYSVGYTQNDYGKLFDDIEKSFDRSKATDIRENSDNSTDFSIFMELGKTSKKRFRTVWRQDTPISKPRLITGHRED